MNLSMWTAIREYIDAEIKLSWARKTLVNDPLLEVLAAQSTRMETAVREYVEAFEKRLNGLQKKPVIFKPRRFGSKTPTSGGTEHG